MDFGPTLKHLQAFFAPRKVIAKVYQSPELEKVVEQGKIDFFFASSGFFYRMLHFGARDLATIVTAAKTKPNFGTAGVFFTRRARKDINTFDDMKDKVLVANYETAFHGYRTGMAELENRGYNHEKFLRKSFLPARQLLQSSTTSFLGEAMSDMSEPVGLKSMSFKTSL